MTTKKWIVLCIFVLTLIVALSAAYFIAREEFGGSSAFREEAKETPVPEPTEEPLPSLVAFAAPQADAAFRAAVASLPRVDIVDTEAALIGDLAGLNAAVVSVASDADAEAVKTASEAGLSIVAYNPMGFALPDAVIEVRYAASVPVTADAALETAIAYPPHDTPVRLFGVFIAASGEAWQAWDDAVAAGRVLSKGTWIDGGGTALEAWFAEKLAAYYPGMVDAAFVETPAQAAVLAKAMIAADRDDFEIFTVGTDASLSALMAENPRLLPTTVQTDDAAAAEACAKALSQLLSGVVPQDVVLESAVG